MAAPACRLRRASGRAGIEGAVGAAAGLLDDDARIDRADEMRQALERRAGGAVARYAHLRDGGVELVRPAARELGRGTARESELAGARRDVDVAGLADDRVGL